MADKLKTITMRELRRSGNKVSLADKLPAQLTNDGEVVAVILPVHVYNKLVEDFSLADKLNTHSQPGRQAKSDSVIPKIPGLMMEGNRIVGTDRMSHKLDDDVQPKLPTCDEYNFRQFKVGDHVLMRRGRRLIETVIPEIDAEGNPCS